MNYFNWFFTIEITYHHFTLFVNIFIKDFYIYFLFFLSFLLVGGSLLYNIVVVFVIHWHESAMNIHVFPIPIPPPTSLSTRSLWVLWRLPSREKINQKYAGIYCIRVELGKHWLNAAIGMWGKPTVFSEGQRKLIKGDRGCVDIWKKEFKWIR